jgi:hypothetical protein
MRMETVGSDDLQNCNHRPKVGGGGQDKLRRFVWVTRDVISVGRHRGHGRNFIFHLPRR